MAFQVEFVSPEASLYSGEGTQVIARTRGGGDIAFLTGHEPFVGSLQASEVRVTELDGTVQSFAVRSGFVSVTGDSVTVLSDEATPSGQLDLEQARADLAAAEAALAADEANAKSILDELVKQQPHKKRPSNAAFLQVAKGVLPAKKLTEIYKAYFKIPELPSKKRTKEQPSWSSLTDNQVEACDALFWSIRKDRPYFTSEVFIAAAQRSKLLPGLSKEADGGPLRAALAARHKFLYHGGGGQAKKAKSGD